MRAYLTNKTLPPNLTPVQKHRFLLKCMQYKLQNGKIVDQSGKIFSEDKQLDLETEYKNVLGGRDKFHWHMKQKYCNITQDDCMEYIRGNGTSQIHRKPPKPKVYKPILSNRKNERWQCDFIQLEKFRRFQYCFTIIDHCTKFAWVFPTYTRGHATLINKIRPLFLQEIPQILQADNEFKSQEFKTLCEETETQIINSSSYKPNSNGLVERFNKTFKEILFKLMTDRKTKDWPSLVKDATHIYNNNYHSTLNNTPQHFWDNNLSSIEKQKSIRDKLLEESAEPVKFKVGDTVRRVIKRIKSNIKNKKSYISQYTSATFTVVQVIKTKIPSYKIKNKDDEILSQTFHNWDLILTN